MRNWTDVLPEGVAIKQHAYERCQMAWRMKSLGFSHKEIGERMGIGKARTGLLVARGQSYAGKPSPIECYFGPSGDIAALADA